MIENGWRDGEMKILIRKRKTSQGKVQLRYKKWNNETFAGAPRRGEKVSRHVFFDATVGRPFCCLPFRNATMVRTKEAAIYKETHQGYTGSIQAIMKATRSLKAHRSTAEAVSLLTKLPPAVIWKFAIFSQFFLFQKEFVFLPFPRAGGIFGLPGNLVVEFFLNLVVTLFLLQTSPSIETQKNSFGQLLSLENPSKNQAWFHLMWLNTEFFSQQKNPGLQRINGSHISPSSNIVIPRRPKKWQLSWQCTTPTKLMRLQS